MKKLFCSAMLSLLLFPCAFSEKVAEFQDFEQMQGKTFSMLTGVPFEKLISSKVANVKEFTYFQSMPDMVLAIKSGKTDAGLMNNMVAELAANRDKKLAVFSKPLGETAFGLGFAKGESSRTRTAPLTRAARTSTRHLRSGRRIPCSTRRRCRRRWGLGCLSGGSRSRDFWGRAV